MLKRLVIGVVTLISALGIGLSFFPQKTLAGPYGLSAHVPWFINDQTVSYHSPPGPVLKDCTRNYYSYRYDIFSGGTNWYNGLRRDGSSQAQMKKRFIEIVQSYSSGYGPHGNYCDGYDNVQRNRTGRQFIIQTMRSSEAVYRHRPTASDVQDWIDRINNPNIAISFEQSYYTWNTEFASSASSYYSNRRDNDMFYSNTGYAWSVVFRDTSNGNRTVYAVKANCGNPVGTGLPSLPPMPTGDITPVSSVTPQYVEPGESVTFNHSATASGTFSGNYTIDATLSDNNSSGSFTVNDGNVTFDPTVNSGNVNRSYDIPLSATIGSQYCETITLNWGSGNSAQSQACATVVARPYVKFLDQDVNFCSGNGRIFTWAKHLGDDDNNPYIGSSSQYATFIYGAIGDASDGREGFFTGASANVANPKQLTFANNLSDVYGNDWGSPTGNCTNYYEQETGDVVAGDVTIASANINPGTNTTAYVNGDAYITGNITYNSVGWTQNSVPSYRLIVNGNIYIAGNVSQLDGFYFAGGNIYTCSTGPTYDPTTNANYYNYCNNKLTVYGAMQALGSVKYWRTAGTLNRATSSTDTSNAAEVFILSPEMYLSRWLTGVESSGSATGTADVQSIRSLPPIF